MNGASFLFKYSLNYAILTAVLLTVKKQLHSHVFVYMSKNILHVVVLCLQL